MNSKGEVHRVETIDEPKKVDPFKDMNRKDRRKYAKKMGWFKKAKLR